MPLRQYLADAEASQAKQEGSTLLLRWLMAISFSWRRVLVSMKSVAELAGRSYCLIRALVVVHCVGRGLVSRAPFMAKSLAQWCRGLKGAKFFLDGGEEVFGRRATRASR